MTIKIGILIIKLKIKQLWYAGIFLVFILLGRIEILVL